jgi:serine/threonine protein phosphatase PrpC
MACDIITHSFLGMADRLNSDKLLTLPSKFPAMSDLLIKAIRLASRAIYNRARENPDQSGMGTTVVASVLEENMIGIAHTGDSRAYRLTEKELIPMTTDHSWVTELQKTGMYEEMQAAGEINKNVITRALGVHDTVEVDFRLCPVKTGEIYILCTDGLCGYADDDLIFRVAREGEGNVDKIVEQLVKLANDRGGSDNVTVVAFKIEEITGETSYQEIKPVTVGPEPSEVLQREDELIGDMMRLLDRVEMEAVPSEKKTGSLLFTVIILAIIVILVLVALAIFR